MSISCSKWFGLGFLLTFGTVFFPQMPEVFAENPEFEAHRIGNDRGEALGVADFNNDGLLDVVSGSKIYLAPDWNVLTFREVQGSIDEKGNGYTWDFANIPMDVDGDGWMDVVACDWFTVQSNWFRNPGFSKDEPQKILSVDLWKETLLEKDGNFEHCMSVDLLGTGKTSEILPFVPKTKWYELDKEKGKFIVHTVSDKPLEYGAGAGDINGDGRADIIRPDAWFEAPEDPRNGTWIEHPTALGAENNKSTHTSQILVTDVDQDGKNDIITASAHGYGIFWYRQTTDESGNIAFEQILIDKSWSQSHAVVLADMNGDGRLDLLSGKRYKAHNGGDPGHDEPVCIYWYELVPAEKEGALPTFKRHTITYDKGIASAMNIEVVDFDKDGDLDIVVTSKIGGPVWFENKTVSK